MQCQARVGGKQIEQFAIARLEFEFLIQQLENCDCSGNPIGEFEGNAGEQPLIVATGEIGFTRLRDFADRAYTHGNA